MSFLVDLLAGGWAKLAGVFGVVAALVAGWWSIRKSGRDAQKLADLQQTAKDGRTGVEIRTEVNRLPDAAVDQRVRKWERD